MKLPKSLLKIATIVPLAALLLAGCSTAGEGETPTTPTNPSGPVATVDEQAIIDLVEDYSKKVQDLMFDEEYNRLYAEAIDKILDEGVSTEEADQIILDFHKSYAPVNEILTSGIITGEEILISGHIALTGARLIESRADYFTILPSQITIDGDSATFATYTMVINNEKYTPDHTVEFDPEDSTTHVPALLKPQTWESFKKENNKWVLHLAE